MFTAHLVQEPTIGIVLYCELLTQVSSRSRTMESSPPLINMATPLLVCPLCHVCLSKTLHAEPKVYLLEKSWNVFFLIQTLIVVVVCGGIITMMLAVIQQSSLKLLFPHYASKRGHLEALHEQWPRWASLTVVPDLWRSAKVHMGPAPEPWARAGSHRSFGLSFYWDGRGSGPGQEGGVDKSDSAC